jgi:hypothetical protein
LNIQKLEPSQKLLAPKIQLVQRKIQIAIGFEYGLTVFIKIIKIAKEKPNIISDHF